MSTLLDNSSRPLWVWILVIVIGSLFIIGLVAILVRCVVVRRRTKCEVDFFSDLPAEKKLTLRRGRIVPAGSYLSLTGSRFGVGSYVGEDLQTPSLRSKSPFEWWASLKGRSSRLSYVSHISTSYPSSPRPGSFYQRPGNSTSKLSLTSKDENCQASVTEVRITRPQATLLVPSFKRVSNSYEPVNFSRSFTPQTQRSLAASRNQTLSRIEEITPRQSFFSTTSLKVRTRSNTQSENDQIINQSNSKRASAASFSKMPPPTSGHSRKVSGNSSYRSPRLQYEQGQSPDLHQSSSVYLPSTPATPTFPQPITESTTSNSRHTLWDTSMKQFPWLEHHRHDHEYESHQQYHEYESQQQYYEYKLQQQFHEDTFSNASIALPTSTTLNNTSLSQANQTHQLEQDYDTQYYHQQTSPPLQQGPITTPYHIPIPVRTLPIGPIRTHSKKGNVLRKKSLERHKMLSNYI